MSVYHMFYSHVLLTCLFVKCFTRMFIVYPVSGKGMFAAARKTHQVEQRGSVTRCLLGCYVHVQTQVGLFHMR